MNSKAISLGGGTYRNDLSRIANEIDKLALNLKGRKKITEDDIERYIGIGKSTKLLFEPQACHCQRDLAQTVQSSVF